MLLNATITCFVLAGALGLYLLIYVLRGKPTPKGIAFTHGPIAALGLVLLLVYSVKETQAPLLSLGLFIAAALGGFFLIYRDIAKGSVPKPVAVIHGLVAVSALVLLLRFAMT